MVMNQNNMTLLVLGLSLAVVVMLAAAPVLNNEEMAYASNTYQAMVALVKLKSYGITEDHILNLNNFIFERNTMNNKLIQNL
jgi:hypothetical protein